ncbi:MAG: ATP-binding protein, partial [Planctomycetes bacterium]|nr:ATP-binding protein [Planctomycetota bacterium]
MSYGSYIPQAQLANLDRLIQAGKVLCIYGPRRVGKTTLVDHYASKIDEQVLSVTGEDIDVRDYLESESVTKLKAFASGYDVLIVDEAQYVNNIGLNLKLLVDHLPGLKIIVTGSSSFDLAIDAGEPLTGRKYTLLLLPLSQMELRSVEAPHQTRARLESRLIYGSYPEVVLMDNDQQRARYLKELVNSYLLKDILTLEGIRHSDKLFRLLQMLSFQIGHSISMSELGQKLGMSKNTVHRYLDLLGKVFVIYSRRGFSRNLRKEITKKRRYYFYDNGVRNALINNFNAITLRDDVGALWENYCLLERMKHNFYTNRNVSSYFWRTYDQQEIDLVEESLS